MLDVIPYAQYVKNTQWFCFHESLSYLKIPHKNRAITFQTFTPRNSISYNKNPLTPPSVTLHVRQRKPDNIWGTIDFAKGLTFDREKEVSLRNVATLRIIEHTFKMFLKCCKKREKKTKKRQNNRQTSSSTYLCIIVFSFSKARRAAIIHADKRLQHSTIHGRTHKLTHTQRKRDIYTEECGDGSTYSSIAPLISTLN